MDISKLAEKLDDAIDGGISHRLGRFQDPANRFMQTAYMARQRAIAGSATEAAWMKSIGFGRTALDEAIANQSKLHREISAVSAAELRFKETMGWQAGGQIAAAVRALGVVNTIAGYDQVLAGQADALLKIEAGASSTAYALARLTAADVVAQSLAHAVSPFSAKEHMRTAWEDRLSSQMRTLDRPWMLPTDPRSSALGFAHLVRLADALRHSPPYSRNLNSFLRDELGEVAEPDDQATPEERDQAAIEAGMRPELIAFPQPAFRDVVVAAGLTLQFPPLPIPQPVEGDDPGASFDPAVHAILRQVESRLRILVRDRLTSVAGDRWIKTRVPPETRDRWLERQAEARAKGRPVYAEIYYADLMDLEAVIRRRDNWQAVFASVFPNKQQLSISLQHLAPIRNDDAHHRPVGMAQMLRLITEAAHILRAMGINVLH